jgi:hypothetical protein
LRTIRQQIVSATRSAQFDEKDPSTSYIRLGKLPVFLEKTWTGRRLSLANLPKTGR